MDRYGQVSARTNRYSVPVRLIGQMVRIVLHPSELVVYDGSKEVARHERMIAKDSSLRPSPATAASTFSVLTSWDIWNWTGAAPNSSSRF
ncbi:Mu transposase domain-containing protein [Streptomyces xanthophaeus]|uniref:Mu transposase domain-containing protein n=1 Tax=Streptomyces xanthophaeus TaxID=67385 RepID=UPI003986A67C